MGHGPFEFANRSLTGPSRTAVAVTPHDTNELAVFSRGLYIGGTGDVTVRLADDVTNVLFTAVPTGTVLPLQAKLVLATGTTATSIVAIL